jgi:aminoglycoside phosphotransferase (APT) family kinase protein
MRSCELRVANPRTLLHADIHPGNWYKTGDGQLGLCDWQCTVIGEWAADFAYAVTSSLSPEDRRAWEGDLLRLYLDALQLPKEMVPSFDQAWLSYRQQTFHGLFNWLFVAGAGAMQPSMQPDDIGRMNVDRMAIAVDDLDSLDAIKKPH